MSRDINKITKEINKITFRELIILLRGICTKKILVGSGKDLCIKIVIKALFVI